MKEPIKCFHSGSFCSLAHPCPIPFPFATPVLRVQPSDWSSRFICLSLNCTSCTAHNKNTTIKMANGRTYGYSVIYLGSGTFRVSTSVQDLKEDFPAPAFDFWGERRALSPPFSHDDPRHKTTTQRDVQYGLCYLKCSKDKLLWFQWCLRELGQIGSFQ